MSDLYFKTKTLNVTAFVSLALSFPHLSYSAFLSVSWKQPHFGSTAVTLFIMCFLRILCTFCGVQLFYVLVLQCLIKIFSWCGHLPVVHCHAIPYFFRIGLSCWTLDMFLFTFFFMFLVFPALCAKMEVGSSTVCAYHGTPSL